eukprot:XP_001707511.1 Hypothetical protein GL50803_5135 [Giardia lamblia ATCC 50803]
MVCDCKRPSADPAKPSPGAHEHTHLLGPLVLVIGEDSCSCASSVRRCTSMLRSPGLRRFAGEVYKHLLLNSVTNKTRFRSVKPFIWYRLNPRRARIYVMQDLGKISILLDVNNKEHSVLAAQINSVDGSVVDEVPVHEGHSCPGQNQVNKGEVLI